MKKGTLLIIILLVLVSVGVGLYFILKKPVEVEPEDNDTEIVEEEEEPEEEEEVEEEIGEGDFTGFSNKDQVIGSASDDLFTLASILDESNTGYHSFEFNLTGFGDNDPYVTAEYLADKGVIRVELNGIEDDNSGIGYQKERSINEEGIIRLYHAVTGDTNKEAYEVGLSQSTIFKLHLVSGDGRLKVVLDVKYPGEVESEIDLGSTEFSTELQEISGVTKTNTATVKSYSYSTSGGVLKFAWTVSATGDNPIPSVNAGYDGNVLVVTFESLSVDKVLAAVQGKSLPGSLTLDAVKSVDSSVYSFQGLTSQRPFKLSATTSPNQVILEIDL
ncbi:MAG: hypothetical protein PHE21_03195 [Candidatus Dojkabacteria bacterium]|nr:hypothetical protein [Candidatus Dojkabacteria bacterium]